MEKIVKKCGNIEELFSLWKKSHLEDCAQSCKNCIFPCKGNRKEDGLHNICKSDKYDIIKKSFLPDGSLSDRAREEHKILFVCREAHNDFEDETAEFWIKANFDSKSKYSSSKYHKCMREIAEAIGVGIEECAFMNINKRGGNSSCNLARLRDYSIVYRYFIEEEIRILNPQRIIILGKLPQETSNIFRRITTDVYPKHPSVYTENTLKCFKEELTR